MMEFEELAGLQDEEARALIRELTPSVLAAALKDAPQAVADKFFGNMPAPMADMVKEAMKGLGSLSRPKIETERRKILEARENLQRARQQVSFAEDAVDEVVSGLKVETLRLKEEFRIDSIARLVSRSGKPIGFLKISGKSEVRFKDLGENDVRSHHSKSLEHLRARLLSFYPDLEPDSVLTRYRFHFFRYLWEAKEGAY